MIYPKYRLAFPGRHVLMFEGKPLTNFNGYKLNTTAIGNGVVSADKSKGYFGESATLYVSAGPNYTYRGMEVDVGQLSGLTYVFGRGDANLSAYFRDSSIRYVILEQDAGGTITATPMTGMQYDEVTLSANSNPHYNFSGYSVIGATLTGNKFTFGTSDVTAKGTWIEDPRYTAYFKQSVGGKLSGTPTTGYSGDEVTLVIEPSAHYSFVSANLTGANLTGNTFAFNDTDVSAEATWLQDPIYTATLVQNVGGRISAVPLTGFSGDIITLFNTPSSHYTFNGYSITGGEATGNQVKVGSSNLTIAGNFVQDPIRSLSILSSVGGSITANKMSGYDNDIVTLSNTANTAYNFTRYDLTGATLTSNQFKFNGNNVSAKGVFTQKPTRTVTINQQTGGTIQATPTTGYDGTIVTLSNTANAGYTFNKYNITGGTLTGNQFTLTGGNVTVQPVWTHNVYSLTLQNDGHGTLAAGKTTGYYNDTTTLTATPNEYYAFANYGVTGGSVSNNTYTWAASNGTVKANFTMTATPSADYWYRYIRVKTKALGPSTNTTAESIRLYPNKMGAKGYAGIYAWVPESRDYHMSGWDPSDTHLKNRYLVMNNNATSAAPFPTYMGRGTNGVITGAWLQFWARGNTPDWVYLDILFPDMTANPNLYLENKWTDSAYDGYYVQTGYPANGDYNLHPSSNNITWSNFTKGILTPKIIT